MKITIIGCGWLGLPLAEKLISEGHIVSGSTTTESKQTELKEKGILPFMYSLEDNSSIPADPTSSEILIVTIPPIQKKEPKVYGSALKKLVEQFSNLNQVIFTSSTGIYPQQSSVYHEDFEFLEMEKETALYYAEQDLSSVLGDKLTILRLSGLFGNGRHPVFKLQGREDVKNPFGLVNLVHQDDVIRCILHSLNNEDAKGTFNVVYPEHPWRKEYYTKLFRQHDLKAINFIISPTLERRIDTTKIRSELGFTFEHSIFDLSDCGLD